MAANTETYNPRLVIYAPGIHTGGGFTLLSAMLDSQTLKEMPSSLFLDSRSLQDLALPADIDLHEITPSLAGRLKAELTLRKLTRAKDTVICLHSLPPLLKLCGHTVCFMQNVLLLGGFSLKDFPLKARLRLTLERFIGRALKTRVDTYIVQTDSMKRRLLGWHGAAPHVLICPFVSQHDEQTHPRSSAENAVDFLYVSDGLAHKNHHNLIQAWILLAEQGVFPKLGLTLSSRDTRLQHFIDQQCLAHRLRIENYGTLTREDLSRLYRTSRALIFPSYTESLGLPLIEATQLGLPIIASERDYVRDVCRPSETFDPTSPKSIARAARRFLNLSDDVQSLCSPDTFIRSALSRHEQDPDEVAR